MSCTTISRCSRTSSRWRRSSIQGTAWPVAWTRTFGKGRVFHTTMGHRDFGPDKDDPVRDPNLSRLIVQGVEWVAEGRAGASKP